MWQRKQGLEVSYLPSTFHTTISSHSSSSNAFSTKESLGCSLPLFGVVLGSRRRESKRPEKLQIDRGMSTAYKQRSCEVPEEKPAATELYIRTDRARPARTAFYPFPLCTQQMRREGRLCTADLSSRSLWGNAKAHLPYAAA